MKHNSIIYSLIFLTFVISGNSFAQTTYNVGPDQMYKNIVDVPWSSLVAGDVVNIHYRSTPYKEKFAVTGTGTESAPITVHGILGPNGERPVIDGEDANTRSGAGGYNQVRGIVNIGGYDNHASYVVVENLEIRNGHTPYTFTNGSGASVSYNSMTAGIFIEASYHITVRNNVIHNCGNGFFVASNSSDGMNTVSKDILVENNYFYGNGNLNSIFEHNSYCEAINITYQYNHYGPLLDGARGYCLKDRSSNTIIRYNWIEGGRMEISLDEAQDASPEISAAPNYNKAFIYGNVLIKTDFAIGGWADDQMVGFGGDQGGELPMRKGPLYIYNNTFITQMNVKPKTGSGNFDRTCVLSISGGAVSVDARNNIFHKTGTATLSFLNDNNPETPSVVALKNNWLTDGWAKSLEGSENVAETSDVNTITGTSPGFKNLESGEYQLVTGSACINAGTALDGDITITQEYLKHQGNSKRYVDLAYDIGAYEYTSPTGVVPVQLGADEIKVFPNPCRDYLNIALAEPVSKPSTLEVISLSGEPVASYLFESGVRNKTISMTGIIPGVYFLRLNKVVSTTKLIVAP